MGALRTLGFTAMNFLFVAAMSVIVLLEVGATIIAAVGMNGHIWVQAAALASGLMAVIITGKLSIAGVKNLY